MIKWRQGEPKVWNWRLCGRSADGRIVTLGKYDTEAEAKKDHDRILDEGFYRSVKIEQIAAQDQP